MGKLTPELEEIRRTVWQNYCRMVLEDFSGLKNEYPFSYLLIPPTTEPSLASVSVTAVNRRIVEASSISFNQSNLKLKVGETAKISYTITPVATTDKTVTYEFDRNYVSLDSSGNLKALRAGVTEVTVKTVNGRSAKLRVEITSPVFRVKTTA